MLEKTSFKRFQPHIAIACGGTGGHLFPGIAIGEELVRSGCRVSLLISPKRVDQDAVKSVSNMEIVTLPAVGLMGRNYVSFTMGFAKSYLAARRFFKQNLPNAVLAMGGFTSAPPVIVGKRLGAKTFLHESNTIPGKANRWLAKSVDRAFVYFPETAARLEILDTHVVGMPVRPKFLQPVEATSARLKLGLHPENPVLLVMGGSQGSVGVNDLVLKTVPHLVAAAPELQYLHLCGLGDTDRVRKGYAALKCSAVVRPFLDDMDLALGAANAVISRAGASSLAELAATRSPAILVPFPAAADNHQFFNASAFVATGAAHLCKQDTARPDQLARDILTLMRDTGLRDSMQAALDKWHNPDAAKQIADNILLMIRGEEAPTSFGAAQGNSFRPEAANV